MRELETIGEKLCAGSNKCLQIMDNDIFDMVYSILYYFEEINISVRKDLINHLNNGLRFLLIIFKIATLYSPLKLFAPVGFGFFVLGTAYYGYTFATQHRFTNMSMLLISAAVIVFLIGLILLGVLYSSLGSGTDSNVPGGRTDSSGQSPGP